MDRCRKDGPPSLEDVDLAATLPRRTYEERLAALQSSLIRIQQAYLRQGLSAAIVFEGWDAAGKGGTIRCMSAVLDPRSFKVWPIGAPRSYYLDRHYLLRFMERLPPRGAISVFDRSWYGRVLVERVEALAPEARWRDAFREIVEFERMLVEDGTRVVKVFMHISPETQLRRFEARLHDPLKRWKLTAEDFRNRERWPDYEIAIGEMLRETSSPHAPWRVVPSNDKKSGRIAAIGEIVDRLARDVDLAPPALEETVLAAARTHLDLDPPSLRKLRRKPD